MAGLPEAHCSGEACRRRPGDNKAYFQRCFRHLDPIRWRICGCEPDDRGRAVARSWGAFTVVLCEVQAECEKETIDDPSG